MAINYPSGAGVTNEVDPVSRIEGHLGIGVNVSGGSVQDAFAHGNLWRGFENFLLNRDVNDAITFVQRICGVCPVPHGMTSTYAVDSVLGYSKNHITFAGPDTDGYGVPSKAVSIRNLVLGAEFLMSSITHFYHLVAPSYIQGPNIPPWTPYFADAYYTEIDATKSSMQSHGKVAPATNVTDGYSDGLWSTVIRSYVVALRIRRLTFEAGALFAGRMPMTSVYCGGGVTFDGQEDLTARANMYRDIMKEIGLFIIQEYVPIALALGILYSGYDNAHNGSLITTVNGALTLSLPAPANYGAGLGRYLAWGAFPDSADLTSAAALALPGGVKTKAGVGFAVGTKGDVYSNWLASGTNAVPDKLTEDIASSRYDVDHNHDDAAYANGAHANTSATAAYPGDVSRTKPHRNKANAYTYMKAPRWNGLSYEVGPMARMYVAGFMVDGQAYRTGFSTYYTNYVKVASGNTGLNPVMVKADIAVCLLRAGLATLQNATLGTALFSDATHQFTYAEVAAQLDTNAFMFTSTHTHAKQIADAYLHADTVISGLIEAWIYNLQQGASTMDRLRCRALESLYLVQQIIGMYDPAAQTWAVDTEITPTCWVRKLKAQTGGANDTEFSTWAANSHNKPLTVFGVQGWGATEAPRGALMHQCTIDLNAKITKYQCIVPTTWNGSPTTGGTMKGAIESACIGAPWDDHTKLITKQDNSGTITTHGGVEVLRIAQSFDPCIACAIH